MVTDVLDLKTKIHEKYLKESIEGDANIRAIFQIIIHCNQVESIKTFKKRNSQKSKAPPRMLLQNDVHVFIVTELEANDINRKEIEYLMAVQEATWENFRKIGSNKGKDSEGKPRYHKVESPVTVAAFCAAAQLTRTPLEEFVAIFFEYCKSKNISIFEPLSDQKKQTKNESSTQETVNVSTGASEGDAYKDRLGRRIYGADKWLDAYNHDELPFVGRDDEQKRLDEFIKCSGPFKIWAIIAPAGAGKTRLMFQWVDTSPALEGWDCRKLEARDIDKPEEWLEWSPDHPTLLIVDYMFGYEKVFEELVRRGHYFDKHHENNPRLLVRLLVIDHHMAEPMQNDTRWGLSRSGESLNFNERLFFDPQPLSLVETSDQEEVITRIISTSAKLESSDPKIEEAKEYLRRTNAAWHPLFAALVGDAVKEERDYSAWNRRELIKYYLKGKTLTWEDKGEPGQWAACLIAAATARRGMSFNDVLGADYPEGVDVPDDFEPIINMCRKVIPNSDGMALPPFEPDLLGENFFLLFLGKLAHVRKLRPAFMQMFIAESEDDKDKITIELIGFLERLSQNLIIEENFHTEYLWQTLLDFLNPNKLPQDHPLRLAMNCCLINLTLRLTESMPEVARDLLTRVDFRDFPRVNGTRLLRTSTWHSMVMVELLGRFEGVKALDALDNLLELWEKNEIKPLFFAMTYGLGATVMMLLVRDREKLTATIYEGQTLLMCACALDNAKIVNFLLEIGVDIDASSNDRNTALMYSVVLGRTEMVSLLLKRKANVRVKDNFGRTALMLAAHLGKTEIAKLLLEQNILTRDDKDNYERTALMYSVIGGHAEMLSMLLRWDADVYVRDDKGFTVLIVACARGYSEIVALLLKQSIDTLDRKDNYGRTALMYASALGHLEIVEKLVEASANIHVKDDIGITALMLAQAAGHTEVVEVLLGKAKTDVF